MSNIGGVFLRPGDGSLGLRFRKKRGALAAAPILLVAVAAICSMFGKDWFEGTITFIAQYLLSFPKLDGLEGVPLELAVYARKTMIWSVYVLAMIFWLVLEIAFWMRSDMLDALQVGFQAEGQAIQGRVENILGEVRRENGRSDRLFSSLNEIKNHLSNPRGTDRIRIALFDNLLVYATLFVADGMGYFAEEGLTVEFVADVGDDRAVAAAVQSGDCDFGACDPFFCLSDGKPKQVSDTDLLILMPLAKRFGFTLLGREDVVGRLDKGPITIGSYEQGSTTYLAAMAFRAWLIGQLMKIPPRNREELEKNIMIEALGANDRAFETPTELAKAMASWDFVLLWEPQTSWVRNKEEFAKFGTVGIPLVSKPGEIKPDEILRIDKGVPQGASGKLGDGSWKAWRPVQGGTDQHKCLISALLTRRDLVRQRPVLCRRVFRALSRAGMHLHGLDWDLDAKASKSLFSAVKGHMRGADYVEATALQEMAGSTVKTVEATERGGMFPFVYGLSNYDPRHYMDSLRSCHLLWVSDQTAKAPPVWPPADYERYFVRPQDLERT